MTFLVRAKDRHVHAAPLGLEDDGGGDGCKHVAALQPARLRPRPAAQQLVGTSCSTSMQ